MKTKHYKKRNLQKTLKKYKKGIKKGGEEFNDEEYITDKEFIDFCDFIPNIKNKEDPIKILSHTM
jgi:hypothetical protein